MEKINNMGANMATLFARGVLHRSQVSWVTSKPPEKKFGLWSTPS